MENNWDLKSLTDEFIGHYGGSKESISVFFAPGRVNLIGEHTDYNGGYVFPCSLHFGTYLLLRKIHYSTITFKSKNAPMTAQVCSAKPITPVGNTWINYPLGVMNEFQKRGFNISGYNLLFAGNIPNSAGLSSSASIEMVTALALNTLEKYGLNTIELVRLCQRAENEFVGMKCGIMDQFAVGMGKKEHAIFLNCFTLEYDLVPVKLGDFSLIITNTNKQRRLADSKYNERRAQCERAVSDLQPYKEIRNLSELSPYDLQQASHLIGSSTVRKRVKHVVTENQRVLSAVDVLRKNDLVQFGRLMFESHQSLKEDYEVSCFELDTLVEEAAKIPGVAGCRMTGAGFGGCTVSLVKTGLADRFISTVGEIYKIKTGLDATFFKAEIGNGARQIRIGPRSN
jgi:galactokinase